MEPSQSFEPNQQLNCENRHSLPGRYYSPISLSLGNNSQFIECGISYWFEFNATEYNNLGINTTHIGREYEGSFFSVYTDEFKKIGNYFYDKSDVTVYLGNLTGKLKLQFYNIELFNESININIFETNQRIFQFSNYIIREFENGLDLEDIDFSKSIFRIPFNSSNDQRNILKVKLRPTFSAYIDELEVSIYNDQFIEIHPPKSDGKIWLGDLTSDIYVRISGVSSSEDVLISKLNARSIDSFPKSYHFGKYSKNRNFEIKIEDYEIILTSQLGHLPSDTTLAIHTIHQFPNSLPTLNLQLILPLLYDSFDIQITSTQQVVPNLLSYIFSYVGINNSYGQYRNEGGYLLSNFKHDTQPISTLELTKDFIILFEYGIQSYQYRIINRTSGFLILQNTVKGEEKSIIETANLHFGAIQNPIVHFSEKLLGKTIDFKVKSVSRSAPQLSTYFSENATINISLKNVNNIFNLITVNDLQLNQLIKTSASSYPFSQSYLSTSYLKFLLLPNTLIFQNQSEINRFKLYDDNDLSILWGTIQFSSEKDTFSNQISNNIYTERYKVEEYYEIILKYDIETGVLLEYTESSIYGNSKIELITPLSNLSRTNNDLSLFMMNRGVIISAFLVITVIILSVWWFYKE